MKNANIPVHGEAERLLGLKNELKKKPWVKPLVEILALESAESGTRPNIQDATGHSTRPKS